jgi:hypothetical protein
LARHGRAFKCGLPARIRRRAASPGADAIATTEQKLADLKSQIDANRALSTSLAFDDEQM